MNTPTAKWVASTRPASSACDETSTAATTWPAATAWASSACSSVASGVVGTPEARDGLRVPMTREGRPADENTDANRWVTVVLPFVPVTPMTDSERLGSPQSRAATGPSAARTSGVTTCGTSTPSSWSTNSATAPAPTASPARSWPSLRLPRTQQNIAPATDPRRVLHDVDHVGVADGAGEPELDIGQAVEEVD